MKQLRLSLVLDREQLCKVIGYYVYRSQEGGRSRPVVGGVYIRRKMVGENPPERIRLLLEWTQRQTADLAQ